MKLMLNAARRRALKFLAAGFAAAALVACANLAGSPPPAGNFPPIVFVHGNGDSASNWLTTAWRFESNGWPRERLHAIDLPSTAPFWLPRWTRSCAPPVPARWC